MLSCRERPRRRSVDCIGRRIAIRRNATEGVPYRWLAAPRLLYRKLTECHGGRSAFDVAPGFGSPGWLLLVADFLLVALARSGGNGLFAGFVGILSEMRAE